MQPLMMPTRNNENMMPVRDSFLKFNLTPTDTPKRNDEVNAPDKEINKA